MLKEIANPTAGYHARNVADLLCLGYESCRSCDIKSHLFAYEKALSQFGEREIHALMFREAVRSWWRIIIALAH